ncbi:TPA: hypothetical protein HA259_07060 [Thermoplasmata archaeon]|nr:hypothetical protein [Thermoplasmata archaeon]
MTEKTRALVVLALLSPLIGEMLSGSSPPLEFFNPFLFALLLGMYGAGALLIRELVIRWRKGWAATIALGAAYGIIEEGIAVKSFFDPGWQDLGALAEYGRYLGVNWVWAVWLTIYHSAISICLPILLVALIFPRLESEPLLGRRGLRVVALLFTADIAFCAVLFTYAQDFFPGAGEYLLAFLATAVLVVVAVKVPDEVLSPSGGTPSWRPWRFALLGFAFVLGSFVVAGAAPEGVHPAIMIGILLLLSAAALLALARRIGSARNRPHKAYFAVGLMSVFIVLSPVHEVNGMMGMSVVGIVFAAFSYWLVRRVGREPEVE